MPRADADLVWLLTIKLPGYTFRLSTRPIAVTEANGTVTEYSGSLSDVDFAEEIDLLSVSPASQTVSVEGHIDPTPAELARHGFDLREGMARLSYALVEPHRNYAIQTISHTARVDVAEGRLAQPAWGDPLRADTWFSASVEATPWTSRVPLLSPAATITAEDFPNLRDDAAGFPFPLVIGKPGDTVIGLYSTPAYVVETAGAQAEHLLIAGYDVASPGDAVVISDGSTNEAQGVLAGITDSGLPYYYVDILASAVLDKTASAYAVAWSAASGVGGASQPGAPSSVGEAIRYLIARAGLPFDIGGSAAAIDYLRAIRFDAYLNDPAVSAWEYLSTQVLPRLPITLRYTSAGLRIDALNPDLPPALATAASPDDGWYRLSACVYDDAPAPKRLVLKGGQNMNTGGYARIVIVDGRADEVPSDQPSRRSGVDVRTRTPIGVQPSEDEAIEIPWCQDLGSLYTLALWRAGFRSARPFTVTYSAPVQYEHLEPGAAVAVTDAALGWIDRVVFVRSKRWVAGRWIFGLWGVERAAFDVYTGG
jgi:hypothetical protein